MAAQIQNDQRNFNVFCGLPVQYADGDIAIYDNVKEVTLVHPWKCTTNLITLVCGGQMHTELNGRPLDIGMGNILLCPPNSIFDNFSCSDDFECKVLSLSDHIVQSLLRDKIDIWHGSVYVNQTNIIRMSDNCKENFIFYYALIRSKIEQKDTPVASTEIIQALIRVLLLELTAILIQFSDLVPEKKMSQGKQLFNKYLNMISSNEVKRRPIALYASELAITPKYLTMLCLRYSGKTASDWVIQYTVEDIRYNLRNTGLSIKEVAAKMGFANMSHFGSYVRKHLGMSPSDYREQASGLED